MASSADQVHADSATAHIEAARAAPHRAALELQQAKAFAKLITDKSLREAVLSRIAAAS